MSYLLLFAYCALKSGTLPLFAGYAAQAGALPVGLTDMTWHRFTGLNAASADLWMALMVGAGYLFGASIEQAVKSGWTAWNMALLGVFLLLFFLAWWRVGRPADVRNSGL
ncbi:hypothetical protein [Denitrobaculum tricleocarpae]|uniref:hypothetical protein n=1 Tax=Denitrobaculum tricleocarpae TaxID=2591009 RepID=UPI001C554CA0|nr:hypothetical protein [Denitrobaculum tricleocarpae]